jgi:hypothetical protein
MKKQEIIVEMLERGVDDLGLARAILMMRAKPSREYLNLSKHNIDPVLLARCREIRRQFNEERLSDMPDSDKKQVLVVLPNSVYERVKQDARTNERSVGGEIRFRIRQFWRDQDAKEN